MKFYYFYNPSSGWIKSKGVCSDEDYPLQSEIGYVKAEGEPSLESHYVVDSLLANRPSMAITQIDKIEVIADGADVATISNIPVDAVARVRGGGTVTLSDPITDGGLELSFDTEGEYQVKLSNFPYKDKEFVINAS